MRVSGVDVYTRVPIGLAKCICMYTCVQPLLRIDSKPMNQDERDERHVQIQAAAFALLKEQGYRKTSMLAIAKRAQASNQTLYAWYSNKQALFRGIIESFGGAAREQLLAALHEDQDPLEALRALGPTLLRFTTDEHAIIMNRAAVTDAAETGVLARAIDIELRTRHADRHDNAGVRRGGRKTDSDEGG